MGGVMRMLLRLLGLPGLGRGWQLAIWGLAGVTAGTGVVLFRISNAVSYLSDAPETCINCHVMTDPYVSWQRGSHAKVAVCNDCHVPRDNLVGKMAFKAMDGARHSYVFTMRLEPQVLTPSEGAIPVIQNNCIRCHTGQVEMIRVSKTSERTCWSCHQNIHGDVHSLSASPAQLRPDLPPGGVHLSFPGDPQ